MRRSLVAIVVLTATGLGFWSLFFSRPSPTSAAGDTPLLIVYSGTDFSGRSLEVTETMLDLPVIELEDGTEFDWNDAIRSLRVVQGTFKAYQHGRCNTELDDTPLELFDPSSSDLAKGWSSLLSATSTGPLELANLERGALGEDISSIELVSARNLPDWAAP